MSATAPSPERTGRRPPRRALIAVGAALVIAVALAAWLLLREQDEVHVYPTAGTLAARATTSVTFRDVGADELGDVTVTGARSGEHSGRLIAHPDGRGAEFRPDEPFAPGEEVTVAAGMAIAGAGGDELTFTVARGSRPEGVPVDVPKPVPPDARVQHFRSRADLQPPQVAVDVATDAATPGAIFVAPKRGESQQGPMIVDGAGELVWFQPLPGREQAFDLRVQTYRDNPVLTWWQGDVSLYRGDGIGRIMDTRYRPIASVRAANGYELDVHEFTLTPRGTALIMAYERVPWDLSDVGGLRDGILEDNVVQEVDVESGALLFEWHALGKIGLGESFRSAPKKQGQPHDPFHFNSIDEDTDGNLLISARHTNTIYKVDRDSGDIVWRLGGKESDFEMGSGTEFKLQHDARRQADGTLTLFDNVAEDLPARGRESRGIRLALDEDEMRATLVREYKHPEALLSPTQGSLQQLSGGGMFIGWGGSQPYFSETDAEGETVFSGRFLAKDVESYRAYHMEWPAHGTGRPTVTARPAGGGATDVWVSWNGATDVAEWRVRGGAETVTVPRTGFETRARIDARPEAVVVEALDGDGRVLGRSAEVAVG